MVLGWPLILGSATVLYLRWQPVDRVILVALVALTPFLAVALAPAAVIAWFSRSTILRVGTAAVVGVYLFTVSPVDAVIGCGPERSESSITIMTANIFVEGGDPVGIADQVRTVNPDVLFLQEADDDFLHPFEDQPELDPWSYRSHLADDAPKGVALIWSKWPLTNMDNSPLDVYKSVQATVSLPSGDVVLESVHLTSPTDGSGISEWYRELRGLAARSPDGPMIIAGDFNATEDHAPFREVLAGGWTDVHDNKGCGLDQTWPTTTLPFPVMRLDHVLVSDHFDVLSTDVIAIEGSDHLSVVSRVRLTD